MSVNRKHQESIVAGSPNILKTKAICTVGPASCSKEMIAKMVEAGMSVCRINMAHSTHEFARSVIENLRSYLEGSNSTAQIGIWLDINGPKVRTGPVKDGVPVYLEAGDEFLFSNQNIIGDETRVSTTYPKEVVAPGEILFVDDGALSFSVLERLDTGIRCRIENSGYLGENKGITFPSHVIEDLPAVSEKDKKDLEFALDMNVDYVSVSCIRNIEDVEEVRYLLGNSKVRLVAKIENRRGMDNFDSILRMADVVVIDRGYLGAEVDVEIVATAQKRMMALANTSGKPVLVANQVLESLRDHPRPTRSEAADVANAVMDGADGLVLSSETAIGNYVIESIQTMRKICLEAEKQTNYNEFQLKQMRTVPKPIGVSESIASSAVLLGRQTNAAIIISLTEVGGTARLVSKYRPQNPVIGATMEAKTARQLAMSFGIVPYYHTGTAENIIHETMRYAVELGLAEPGQIVAITSGQVIGFAEGTTTKMQILHIPDFSK